MATPVKGIALVTGAARGIGRGIALRLAADGYDVAVNDIASKSEEAQAVADDIGVGGRRSIVVICDISNEESVKHMINEVVEKLGALNVMVANAGILRTGTLITTTTEQWEQVFAVNARGVFLCYKYAAEQMIKQGHGGRIVGACSLAGKMAFNGETTAYSASKFAVRSLTQTSAIELGKHGITVNAYAPGCIDTPMADESFKGNVVASNAVTEEWRKKAPTGTIGTPADVAGLVSYLVSDGAKFVTGQSVNINGGIVFD